jgi:flagellar hook-associated protein 1 FlgK
MSITGALSNALSGLTAASRTAEVVASNIANASNEGYASRSVSLSSRQGTTGGVRIDAVQREVNPTLLMDRRLAEADHSQRQDMATALSRIESLFGTPVEADSLIRRAVALETALVEAASRPDAPERLHKVVTQAADLAEKFRGVSDGLQSIRTGADRSIASQVAQLNSDLEKVQLFNQQIVALRVQGSETASLLDARQAVIDRISHAVPVLEIPRDRGAVALFTQAGAVLLDGSAALVGFEPANLVAPQMTLSGGLLSGLTVNNVPVSTDPVLGPFSGGSLSAAFQVRDEVTVAAQRQLDGLARELSERFVSNAVDPTLSLGQPGLFTDSGTIVDAAAEIGLAGRLMVNPLVDPAQGGLASRLRDGLGAGTAVPTGDSRLLNRMIDALSEARQPASPSFGLGATTFAGLLSNTFSEIGSARQSADQRQSFAGTRASALKMAELEKGVDTDEQLQRLLMVEQAYSANARVIQAVDEMLDSLLRI